MDRTSPRADFWTARRIRRSSIAGSSHFPDFETDSRDPQRVRAKCSTSQPVIMEQAAVGPRLPLDVTAKPSSAVCTRAQPLRPPDQLKQLGGALEPRSTQAQPQTTSSGPIIASPDSSPGQLRSTSMVGEDYDYNYETGEIRNWDTTTAAAGRFETKSRTTASPSSRPSRTGAVVAHGATIRCRAHFFGIPQSAPVCYR